MSYVYRLTIAQEVERIGEVDNFLVPMIGKNNAFVVFLDADKGPHGLYVQGHKLCKGLIEQGETGRSEQDDEDREQTLVAAGELPHPKVQQLLQIGEVL